MGATVLRSSCSGDGFSIAGSLLESLLHVMGDSLGTVRLSDTLVCVVRKEDTWESVVKDPGRFWVWTSRVGTIFGL